MKGPVLFTPRLMLRYPRLSDLKKFEEFLERNYTHFEPWESTLKTPVPLRQQLDYWIKECDEESAARFFLFKREDESGPIIGQCNFSQILRGPFYACYLGYRIDKDFEGQGLMFEALKQATDYVFDELNIHRIMAGYMPINVRSGRLLKKLDFTIEGYARDYLIINNRWEDHILTSLTNPRWRSFIS